MTDHLHLENRDLVAPLVSAYEELTEYSFPFVASLRLGANLDQRGGMRAMVDASVEVFRLTGERHSTGYHFNQLWSGVGDWRA